MGKPQGTEQFLKGQVCLLCQLHRYYKQQNSQHNCIPIGSGNEPITLPTPNVIDGPNSFLWNFLASYLTSSEFVSPGTGNNEKPRSMSELALKFLSYFSYLSAFTHSLKKESSLHLFSKLAKTYIEATVINNSFLNSFHLQ